MKFRTLLAVFAIIAGLAFGVSALPNQTHAAAITLSDSDRSNMQAVLDLTEITLDTIQLQIDRNEIQNPTATLSTLSSIRVSLLNMDSLLGGSPVSMLIEEQAPVVSSPVAFAPEPAADPVTPVTPEASGEVAGSATVEETETNQQTASVNSSSTSRRAFWIILITAIVIAIILAIPRKKDGLTLRSTTEPVAPQTPQTPNVSQAPQTTSSEDKSETVQSA